MDRLETRELVYFVAVAEELHFGRAAERLGIAQPALSRAIGLLERRLGVLLLERTSRSVCLTDAGLVLLTEARTALDAVAAAVTRTRRAGRSSSGLVLALKPGADAGLLPAILATYAEHPRATAVEVRTCGMGEQAGLLRRGVADLALVHAHHADLRGLDSELLLSEPQVVVIPAGHRWAGRPAVSLADLDAQDLPVWRGRPDDGRARPDGEPPGALPADPVHALQHVALGQALAVLPASARLHVRQDLTCLPVPDAEPTDILVTWATGRRSPALAALVSTALAVAACDQTRDGTRDGTRDVTRPCHV